MQPKTPTQWQDAVDLAEFYLRLDSARKYGLIQGGPAVNIERCGQIIRQGAKKGFTPKVTDERMKEFTGALLRIGPVGK